MATGYVHTVHKNGQWINEIEGGSEFGAPHVTKEDAVAAVAAVALAQRRTRSST